jgi:hypothetical protein
MEFGLRKPEFQARPMPRMTDDVLYLKDAADKNWNLYPDGMELPRESQPRIRPAAVGREDNKETIRQAANLKSEGTR